MVNQTVPSSHGKRVAAGLIAGVLWFFAASAANATISQTPLFLTQGVEPQVMLSLSNDHQLFFEAYPDYLDLDGDGQPDLTYGHGNDYYGYFDSDKCYDYSTDSGRFVPAAVTADKYCDGVSGDWSGNFLNYLSMSRMDVVRKILFGGYRRVDTETLTVLERAYVPTDAHSWVRYYNQDDLNRLTPFSNGGTVQGGSGSRINPGVGNRTFTINSSTAAFMNSVQRGDQVRVLSDSASLLGLGVLPTGGSFMLGVITNVDSGNNRITVNVQRASGIERNSWTVENLSRAGVSFCNTTNNASLNDGEPVPASKAPRLSVAEGHYGLWNANQRYQCRWSNETNNSNDNNIGITEFPANDRNPNRNAVGLGQQDYTVRVEVCASGLVGSERCKEYPDGNLKPIGLLQQYGDDDQILFGLLSGSYLKNKSGGVLRKNVSNFGDEVNALTDGTFKAAPSTGGIVNSLNLLRIYGYGTDGLYTRNAENCSFGLSSFADGRCMSWGNPQAEIFLESIRYFAGLNPTTAFAFTGKDRLDGLTGQPWNDTLSEELQCSPLNVINFNSSAASYDRDQLTSVAGIPGSGGVAGIRSIVDSIGESEGINGKSWFLGETQESNNQLCTSKALGSLANAVGLCPEAPRLSAGFDAVGIANFAYENDIRSDLSGSQNVKTFAVALAPAVPRIDIARPGESEVAATILPACRNGTVGGNCAIVDFKVVRQDQENGTGLFYVNWEDSEQGGDYDQDMFGTLEYTITGTQLSIVTRVGGQSTPYRMGFGYVLNGTTKNGFHSHSGINGFNYDDPTDVLSCNNCQSGNAASSVTYDLSSGATTEGLLESPMFYAAKWAGYDKQANFPSDPASWDADGDGIPDNYYFAIDPSQLATDLELVFADILRSSSAAASVAASSSSLSTDTAVYQASFNSENWSGDLRAFSIESDGSVSDTFTWSAAAQLDNLTAGNIENRNIITNESLSDEDQVAGEWLSAEGTAFEWDDLDDSQQLALRQNLDGTVASEDLAELRVEYLRGDRSNELTLTNTDGFFRERDSRLGDIINSNPQFVYQQNFGYANLGGSTVFSSIDDYNGFRASAVYQDRPPLVVVGGNDGMLHGFNASSGADGGKELFAYVPSEIIPNLSALTERNYSHRYYVDGSPRVADAWLGSALGWRTIAVGATGAGGRSIFALDVTNPENVSEDQFLWEFSHPDLGRTLQQPGIVPMPNGEFAVVVSSGFADAVGTEGGKVWLLNASTGRPFRTFDFPGSGQFGSPLAVDLNNDRIVDRIYVGDSEGQIWRIDTEGSNSSLWGVPGGLKSGSDLLPLFTAPEGQPITAPLTSAFNEKGEHMVFFGTGSFIRQGDNVVGANPEVQAFYGIIDDDKEPVSLDISNLLPQEILTRVTQVEVEGEEEGETQIIDIGLTAVSNNQITSQKGWYLNLEWKTSRGGPGLEGERVTARALVRGDRVIFTSLIPSADPCAAGGTSWLYELDTLSGGRLTYAVFDINNDNKFDDADFIEIVVEGETIRIPPSGFNPDVGIINTPTVLTDPKSGDERKIFTGSSGQIISVPEAGSISRGRQNWEQIR
jgi:type IV pilus assembly protein PilY1